MPTQSTCFLFCYQKATPPLWPSLPWQFSCWYPLSVSTLPPIVCFCCSPLNQQHLQRTSAGNWQIRAGWYPRPPLHHSEAELFFFSLSVWNLPVRQHCLRGCPVRQGCLKGGHSQGSKIEPPTSFSRDCGEATSAQNSSDQHTKRKSSRKARPRNGEIVFLLRQGSYVSQAGPKFTKWLKMTLNLASLASSSHMLRLYSTEGGTHGFTNTKQTLCHWATSGIETFWWERREKNMSLHEQ